MTVMDQNDRYSMRQWINGHFGKSKMTVFQKTKNNGHFEEGSFWYFIMVILVATRFLGNLPIRDRLLQFQKIKKNCLLTFPILWSLKNTMVNTPFQNINLFFVRWNSNFIPKFTKIFEYSKNFRVIVFVIQNNAFRRSLSPWALSRAEKSYWTSSNLRIWQTPFKITIFQIFFHHRE